MFIVITGTSCSGKTTTINALKMEGHLVIEEVASKYISEQKKKGFDISEIMSDLTSYQLTIVDRQLTIEREYLDSKGDTAEEPIFLDRSLIDCLAFNDILELNLKDEIKSVIKPDHYIMAFILDPLPFVDDGIRWETNERQQKTQKIYLEKVYSEIGISLIPVPVMDVNERVVFIKEYIEEELRSRNKTTLRL